MENNLKELMDTVINSVFPGLSCGNISAAVLNIIDIDDFYSNTQCFELRCTMNEDERKSFMELLMSFRSTEHIKPCVSGVIYLDNGEVLTQLGGLESSPYNWVIG